MSLSPFKKNHPPAKAVRRAATQLLDEAIASLSDPAVDDATVEAARQELLRLRSLLLLVRRPLTGEVFNREHRALGRALRQMPALPIDRVALLDELTRNTQATVPDELRESLSTSDTKRPKKPAKGPDPRRLRMLADLAEVRMRARYWHLPAKGFAVFAAGLRTTYQRAAKTSASLDAAAAAESLGQFADQLRLLEKAWPAVLGPCRKTVDELQGHMAALARFESLRPALADQPELLALLDQHREATRQTINPLVERLFAESAAAFTKRMSAYWDAWRHDA